MAASLNNEQAIRRCVELFNRCTLEWVDTCYAQAVEWTELPILGIRAARRATGPSCASAPRMPLKPTPTASCIF